MFTYNLALDELDPALVNGLEAAIANAYRFAEEVVQMIRGLQREAAA
jgi:hypothetical protein